MAGGSDVPGGIVTPVETAFGRCLVTGGDASLEAGRFPRARRFPFAAETVGHAELAADMIPANDYLRGDGAGLIPEPWRGSTFLGSFGIAGADTAMMASLISVLRGCDRLVVYDREAARARRLNGGTAARVAGGFLDELHAASAESRTAWEEPREGFVPLLSLRLDVPDSRDEVRVHGDFYDGGSLPKNPLLPTYMMDFFVRPSTEEERRVGFSTSGGGRLYWEYRVLANIGLETQRSKMTKVVKRNLQAPFDEYRKLLLRSIRLVDAMAPAPVPAG